MRLQRLEVSTSSYITGGTAAADQKRTSVYGFTLVHGGADAKATFYDIDPGVGSAEKVLCRLAVTDEKHTDSWSPGGGQGYVESQYGIYVDLTAAGIAGIEIKKVE